MRNLWNDEAGFVLSAELVLVLTIGVLAMIVGLSEVAVAINSELNDISNAIGAISQDYAFTGFKGTDVGGKVKSSVAGTTFSDSADVCDKNSDCDLVGGVSGLTDCGE